MNQDDLRLSSILSDGKEGDIVIVGCPFSYVRKRCINKEGQQNGPCCVRRFFGKVGPIVNPEYGISIKNIKVTDYGNISYKEQKNGTDPQKCITKISEQISSILKSNRIPFIFGGSKQCLYGSSIAFNQNYSNSKHIVISGKPNLKRPYDSNKLTSENVMTMLGGFIKESIVLFGPSEKYFPQEYQKCFDYISYEQIRRTSFTQTNQIYTQAGHKFNALLSEMEKIEKIHVSLTVEAIERFRGSRDVLSLGLSIEQMIEIFFLLGQNKKVVLLDISEFNPSVEDYESSLMLVNLLYYFLMGYTLRQK